VRCQAPARVKDTGARSQDDCAFGDRCIYSHGLRDGRLQHHGFVGSDSSLLDTGPSAWRYDL
jgi:hypothetical protein